MAVEIRMPQVASDMTAADVIAWLVEPGDTVQKGDLLLEIETEKSTVEVEAPASGTLREILVPAGTNEVAVGALLGTLDPVAGASETETQPAASSPNETATSPDEAPAVREAPASPSRAPASPPAPVATQAQTTATALARRVAEQAGLDLGAVTGTGPHGRITRQDVEQQLHPGGQSTAAPARTAATAERSATAAELLQLTAVCRIDALIAEVERLNAIVDGPDIAPRHAIVRAAALGVRAVPEARSLAASDAANDGADGTNRPVAIALSVTTAAGASRSVVRDADRTGLAALARELADGSAAPPEPGASSDLALVDLGVPGIDGVRLVPEAPTRCVLGIGAPRAEPVVEDGQVVPGTTIRLTLVADRRHIDESSAARLLAAVRVSVERPVSMLL